MSFKKRYERWLILGVAVVLFFPAAVRFGIGAAGTKSSATATFQRTVDTPSPGPKGSVQLKKNGSKQTFLVDIRDLEGESFGLFLGFSNNNETNIVCDTTNLVCVTNLVTSEITCTTNCVTNEVKVSVGLIGVLRGLTNNHWVVEYEANDGFAPVQLSGCFTDGMNTNCISDLDDLAGMFLFIANPSDESNTVNAVLFAEVPPLTTGKSVKFKGKTKLALSAVPPNPNAKGFITEKFDGTRGTSLLDIRCQNLFGGQQYSLWMSTIPGGIVVTNIADMAQTNGPGKATFRRYTAMGDQLPFSTSVVTNLSGFNIEIRDAFDGVHLQGTIP